MDINALIVFSLTQSAIYAWVNDWDRPFKFQCPAGKAISRIESVHSNDKEDRIWDFECQSHHGSSTNCYWTGYVNSFDNPLNYRCTSSRFITGIESYHDNGKEDRRFKFRCCGSTACRNLQHCHHTNYINQYDEVMDFDVFPGLVVAGAYSVHDNGREDRIWKLTLCTCYDVANLMG